jgi:hypothetical protein
LELFAALLKNAPTDWRFLHFRSLADEFFQIKAGLLGKGIIPERCLFSPPDPVEGVIGHLTPESGETVANCEIMDITASSGVDVPYISKYVAYLTDVGHIFLSEIKPNP